MKGASDGCNKAAQAPLHASWPGHLVSAPLPVCVKHHNTELLRCKGIPQATIISKGPPMLSISSPHLCSLVVQWVPRHGKAFSSAQQELYNLTTLAGYLLRLASVVFACSDRLDSLQELRGRLLMCSCQECTKWHKWAAMKKKAIAPALFTIGCKIVPQQRQIGLQVSCPHFCPKFAHHHACTTITCHACKRSSIAMPPLHMTKCMKNRSDTSARGSMISVELLLSIRDPSATAMYSMVLDNMLTGQQTHLPGHTLHSNQGSACPGSLLRAFRSTVP